MSRNLRRQEYGALGLVLATEELNGWDDDDASDAIIFDHQGAECAPYFKQL